MFAERLSVSLKKIRVHKKPYGYWKNSKNVKRELLEWVKKYGTPGKMPKYAELCNTGHAKLAYTISKLGGPQKVADLLNLKMQRRARGYWDNGQLEKEMKEYLVKVGTICFLLNLVVLAQQMNSAVYQIHIHVPCSFKRKFDHGPIALVVRCITSIDVDKITVLEATANLIIEASVTNKYCNGFGLV